MLKFPARESYCVTLIVFVLLTSQERIKITIQNNIYCSRIQVAFLDTMMGKVSRLEWFDFMDIVTALAH